MSASLMTVLGGMPPALPLQRFTYIPADGMTARTFAPVSTNPLTINFSSSTSPNASSALLVLKNEYQKFLNRQAH
jgi:hypothetical protein